MIPCVVNFRKRTCSSTCMQRVWRAHSKANRAKQRTCQCGDRLAASRRRLHVSDRLLGQNDGAMLDALKRLNGGTIHLPGRIKDYPDRDRLALRFERFKAAA
jgi:hypothetical protein